MKALLTFLATLLLCYAVDWAPLYVVASWRHDLRSSGRITSFRQACTQAETARMKCTDSFVVPKSAMPGDGKLSSIGLGIFISASEIYCREHPDVRIRFGGKDNAAQALDLLKTYQTVDIDVLKCKDAVVVDVWGPREYRRSGYIGGPLTFGSRLAVNQVKRTVEFFTIQYHYLLALALLGCLIITNQILRPVINAGAIQGRRQFRAYSVYWTAFALVKSGLLELALPVLGGGFIYIRISNLVSALAHLSPALGTIAESPFSFAKSRAIAQFVVRPLHHKIRVSPFQIILIGVAASPYFARALGLMTATCVFLYLLAAIASQRVAFALFAVAALLETGKLFNVPFMPYGSTTLTFASALILADFLQTIRQGARTTELLNWMRDAGGCRSREELFRLLERFGEKFSIGRISLIEPKEGGSCGVTVFNSVDRVWKREAFYREAIPPVFSHVLTTRDAVWHVDEDSYLANDLRKGSLSKGIGTRFSVLPLLKEGVPVGALAITSYADDYAEVGMRSQELRLGCGFVGELATQFLWSESVSVASEWYRRCSNAGREILELAERKESNGLQIALAMIAEIIRRHTGCGVFLARVNSISRRYDLKVTAGFSHDVDTMYQETQFFALQGNLQGPMPIAVNSGKVVTVTDLSWLFPVLHPLSLAILKRSECQSAAATPILVRSGERRSGVDDPDLTWGLIWLESRTVGDFTAASEPGLKLLASAVGAFVERSEMASKAVAALATLARQDVAERLLRGQQVREPDTGYLVVADVRGSTRIANELGAETWIAFTERLRQVLSGIATSYGFTLQLVVWDSFFFTVTSQTPDPSKFGKLIRFCAEIEAVIELALHALTGRSSAESQVAAARFCVEFGDTTRDISHGSWTITGAAMARVSKLEAACKRLSGWLFCAEDLPLGGYRFQLTEETNPSTGKRIVSVKSIRNASEVRPEIRAIIDSWNVRKAA